MTDDRTPVEEEGRAARFSAMDGLRGITIILVMLGHGGNLLWPLTGAVSYPGIRGFFGGGAVGVFFVISGYLVARTLIRDQCAGRLDPVRFYLRRLVRLGVQVVPLAVFIVIVRIFDATDTSSMRATVTSALNVVTHTYNQHAAADLLATRADLGHMWYLSVLQQVYLVLPLLFVLLLDRRLRLGVLLLELMVLSILWRQHLLGSEGWIAATISTFARADAILLGTLIGLFVASLRPRLEGWAPLMLGASLVSLTVLLALIKEIPGQFPYLTGWGITFTLFSGVAVLGIVLHAQPSLATRLLSARPLTILGRSSFVLFVWHLPLFMLVERHTQTWDWMPRTIVAISLLAVVTWGANRLLEEPTRRWLRHHLHGPPAQRDSLVAVNDGGVR